MSEELTYAELKFQNSNKTENIAEYEQVGVKAPPAPSRSCHGVWALSLLCLLLLIGLGVLGSIFHLTSNKEKGKLKKLQRLEEELQRNVSLQLVHIMDDSKKIKNLSSTLQEVATKLCYELYKKDPEHKCNPCPKGWMWHEDSCYKLFSNSETWQKSDMACSAQNASLLKIKNKRVLKFLQSKDIVHSWIGLSPRRDRTGRKDLDETVLSFDWFTRNTSDLDKMFCGYLYSQAIYYEHCKASKYRVCEKLANPVQIESTLINEEPDG